MRKYVAIGIGILLVISLALISNIYFIAKPLPLSLAVGSALGLPFGSVNGTVVPLRDIQLDYKAARLSGTTDSYTDKELYELIWAKIVDDIIVQELISKYNVSVQIEDTEEFNMRLLDYFGFQETDYQDLQQSLGYDVTQFSRRVMIPVYRKQQLRKHILLNEPNNAINTANDFYAKVKQDPNLFETEARTILEITDAASLPELTINQADLINVYSQIATLAVGDVSPVIANPDGYRVYKVKNIISDETGMTTYQLQEFFIAEDIFARELKTATDAATITIYPKNIL